MLLFHTAQLRVRVLICICVVSVWWWCRPYAYCTYGL